MLWEEIDGCVARDKEKQGLGSDEGLANEVLARRGWQSRREFEGGALSKASGIFDITRISGRTIVEHSITCS